MGFIDLSGSLGRHFGSIGVALHEISTRLTVSRAEQLSITGPAAQRAKKCGEHVVRSCNHTSSLTFRSTGALPFGGLLFSGFRGPRARLALR
jgi:predicted sugar kinase